MPPSSSSPVSMQILQTLQRMEKNSSGGGSAGRGVTGAVVAGNIATQVLHSAVSAAPTSGGTLSAQGGLLMQAIGSDPAVVSKVMALANVLNQLRNAWDGAGAASRNYAVNSAIGASAIGAATRYIPSVASTLGSISPTRSGALAQGAGVMGLGYATELAFGRNLASSGLETLGAYQMGVGANRYLMRKMAGMRRAGTLSGSSARAGVFMGRLGIAGAIGAVAYEGLPRGEAGTETEGQVRSRGGNWEDYQALHGANTRNSIFNHWARADALGGHQNLERAAERAGVINRGTTMWGKVARLWDNIRPWSTEETDRVLEAHQNPTNAGLRAAQNQRGVGAATRRRDELTLALGFQSRQMDIGDLHGQVQQEAVKTETQQQSMNYLAQELRNAVAELQRLRGNGSPPSSN